MSRRRIVVTGGAGFIGTHTVAKLVQQGDSVLVVDDLRHACGVPLPDAAERETGELSSASVAEAIVRFRPDAVLHLAAQGGVSRSVRDPAGDALVNVVGTVSMLKACVDSGCRRFVFASSGGAIYGHAPRLPSPERTTARPLSPYGAAKLAAEGYLGMFARTFGLSAIALRYSNVYGPHQDGTGEAGLVAITCERLLAGRPPEIRGDGEQTRDFVYVGDVVQANLLALAGKAEGVLNIGTGRGTSVRTIAHNLVALSGWSGPVDVVPGRPGEVRHTALDIGRAARVLGWRPTIAMEEGLRQTFVSFQERSPARSGAQRSAPAAGGARPGPEPPAGSE